MRVPQFRGLLLASWLSPATVLGRQMQSKVLTAPRSQRRVASQSSVREEDFQDVIRPVSVQESQGKAQALPTSDKFQLKFLFEESTLYLRRG